MTDLEKRAEDFVSEMVDKGNYYYAVGDNVCFFESSMKQALVKFTQQETKLLADRVKELEKEGSRRCTIISGYARKIKELTDKVNELKKRFEPQAFTEVISEVEDNYNNKVRLTESKEIIRELVNIIDYLNEDEYGKEDFPVVHKAEAFLKE